NVRIWRCDGVDEIELVAIHGTSDPLGTRRSKTAHPWIVAIQALAERRTVQIEDVEVLDDDALEGYRPRVGETATAGQRSRLSTPIWRDGEPVGAITVARDERRPFHPEEVALIETFAAQAVIAMENARLFNDL